MNNDRIYFSDLSFASFDPYVKLAEHDPGFHPLRLLTSPGFLLKMESAPNFDLIEILLEYRPAIKFLAVVDILSGIAAFFLDLLSKNVSCQHLFPLQETMLGWLWCSLLLPNPQEYTVKTRRKLISRLVFRFTITIAGRMSFW